MVIKTLLPETAQPTPAARRREAHTLERRTAILSTALKQFSINGTSIERMAEADSAVNINMGTLVGSYASIAAMLDEVADVPGCGGVLLTVDDFVVGMDLFGRHIQPLMRSRRHVDAPVLELAE